MSKPGAFVPYIVAVLLLLVTVSLLAVASIPYATLKPQLEALTLHGHAAVFTESFHRRVVTILHLASMVTLVVAAIVVVWRRRIASISSYAVTSLTAFFAQLSGELVDAMRRESRLHLGLLAFTLVLALAMRLMFLFQPMRYDESYTFTHFASTPLYLILSNFSSTNNHIFHTILVHFSYLLLGSQPWALRLPALISGWMLVPATYVVARTFYDKQAALLAALLVASSSPLIEFSTNARGYTLMTLFFLLLLALAPYCLRASNSAPWILFSVITALGFYTLPTMLFGFAVAAGWLFLIALVGEPGVERPTVVRGVVLASLGGGALTVLLYSPVLMVWGTNMRNTAVLPQSWQTLASGLPGAARDAWRLWNDALPGPATALLVFGFAIGVVFHSRASRYRVSLVVGAILWIVLAILIQRVVPYGRTWIFLLPLYLVVASVGLQLLWSTIFSTLVGRRAAAFEVVALLLGLALAWNVATTQSVYYAEDTGTLRDGEAIAAWMKENLGVGDVMLAVTPADGPLEYYFLVHDLPAADYWYSTQVHGPDLEFGRRVVAVVKDAGPDLDAMLKKAGLAAAGLSSPELIQRFRETAIYQMVSVTPQT